MKITGRLYVGLILLGFLACSSGQKEDEWVDLFNGKDLNGWKANESPESFKVVDGVLVANGLRSHLFYIGESDQPATFTDFELSFEAKTHHLANSGVYFHTAHQHEGWLSQGYELQINSTHRGAGDYKEVKKGGSLYGVRNLYKAFTKDSVWYQYNLRVEGKRIQIRINDQLVVDYTEPPVISAGDPKRKLSSGTFALQGHDPESTVHFRNIRIKRLPTSDATVETTKHPESKVLLYQANHLAFIDHRISTAAPFDIDLAMQEFYKTGINLGLVVDAKYLADQEAIGAQIQKYNRRPVFVGVFAEDIETLSTMQPSTLSQFDYAIGSISHFTDRQGKNINIVTVQDVGNEELFMNDYVNAITAGMDKRKLNIWSSPTLLPSALSERYDKLWTNARMLKVIEAAKRNNVAIEVDNEKRIPSIPFLKLAKEKGCLFTNGGLYKNNSLSEPHYFYEVIDQCKLDYKDIYIPGNPN